MYRGQPREYCIIFDVQKLIFLYANSFCYELVTTVINFCIHLLISLKTYLPKWHMSWKNIYTSNLIIYYPFKQNNTLWINVMQQSLSMTVGDILYYFSNNWVLLQASMFLGTLVCDTRQVYTVDIYPAYSWRWLIRPNISQQVVENHAYKIGCHWSEP